MQKILQKFPRRGKRGGVPIGQHLKGENRQPDRETRVNRHDKMKVRRRVRGKSPFRRKAVTRIKPHPMSRGNTSGHLNGKRCVFLKENLQIQQNLDVSPKKYGGA